MSKKKKNKVFSIPELNANMKPQESFIGLIDFEWPFTVATFIGECSMPEKLNIFEETICQLLSTDKDLSLLQIGTILGLDMEHDLAEKDILIHAIDKLKREKMVEGDESIYWITELGEKNLKDGTKNATYTKRFDLYIDALGDVCTNAKKIFESLEYHETTTFKRDHLPDNIEDVKAIAERQAPEIHYPKKNYILQSCSPDPETHPQGYVALVQVALMRNEKTNEFRVLVRDKKSKKIIDELSDALNKLDEQKQFLYKKITEM